MRPPPPACPWRSACSRRTRPRKRWRACPTGPGNKGWEAAMAGVEMATLLARLGDGRPGGPAVTESATGWQWARQARDVAVQMLYQWEVGRLSVPEVAESFWRIGEIDETHPGAGARARRRTGSRHGGAGRPDRSHPGRGVAQLAPRSDAGDRSADPAARHLRAAARSRHAAARWSSTKRSNWHDASAPRKPCRSSTASSTP